MVSNLLLSGATVSNFSLLMGGVSVYNLIVKLNDMKEEIHNFNHEMVERKVNLKIILWWAGAFLGKCLHDMMRRKLCYCTFDSDLPLSADVDVEVRNLACPQYCL